MSDKELEQFIESKRGRIYAGLFNYEPHGSLVRVQALEAFLSAYLAERDKRVIDYLKQCFKEDHHLSQMLTIGDIDDKLDVYAANLKGESEQ